MIINRLIVITEDELSGAIIHKALAHCHCKIPVDRTIITHGNTKLLKDFNKYKSASRVYPHLVLTDLDNFKCVIDFLNYWKLSNIPNDLIFSIAVREVESWLLADKKGLSSYLKTDSSKFPLHPELEKDPKRTLVNLARKSRIHRIAQGMVPEYKSSAPIGPLYNLYLIEFVNHHWDIDTAQLHSQSLRRFIRKMGALQKIKS